MGVGLAGDSGRLNDPSVARNSASLSLPSAASGKVLSAVGFFSNPNLLSAASGKASLNDACLAENSATENSGRFAGRSKNLSGNKTLRIIKEKSFEV